MRVTRFDVGEGTRVLVTHENITGRRVAERLERERAGLRDAVKGMEQVLGVVGHELRTPLAGLRAITEFLLMDGTAATGESKRFLHDLGHEVDRMAETVNNLLEAARLNSGRARWNWGHVDLHEICNEAIESIRALVDPSAVSLSLDAVPRTTTIEGDGEALRRLVVNLLSNARKHTSQGSISVQVRDGDGGAGDARCIEIVVRDTGSGIAPNVLARLGEAFALNSGVVGGTHVRGTGLGLAICKGIIAAHGGELLVDSVKGKGTTVTARLRADLTVAAEGDTVPVGQNEEMFP
jgi:signal transduction histidine kinase